MRLSVYLHEISDCKYKTGLRHRKQAAQKFQEQYFAPYYAPICKGYSALVEQAKEYGAVITGSDQLWTPAGLGTNFYNLMFVPNEIPKISYASSFGVSQIPFYQKKRTAEFLRRIEHISVRENAGQKIVKELTGRDVPVVADPTLLLTASEWEKEIAVRKPYEFKYIFAYLLGKNPEHRKRVEELRQKTGLTIVAPRHSDEFVKADVHFGDHAPSEIGPAEFVNLVRHAEYVCTDSFHGSVFSILHHRQFLTFPRYAQNSVVSKNSRIESLFQNFGLENRLFRQDIASEIQAQIEWDSVDEKVAAMREVSFAYLQEALKCVM
jgi:hypothetical protein